MSDIVDWDTTHVAIVRYLSERRCPVHYRTLHDMVGLSYIGDRFYGSNTNAAEKLRQYYAEHERPDAFNYRGVIALRRWFASMAQLQLLQPQDRLVIQGNCIVSFEAGFEQAKRQAHMYDHFGDGNSQARYERRRRASLVEKHVQHYFKTHYAEFYSPPTNDGRYERWAEEDFFLSLPGIGRLSVDVKSWTGPDDDGQGRGYVRNPKSKLAYLWADWLDDDTVVMTGIQPGAAVSVLGDTEDGQLYRINGRHTESIDNFIVLLNMAKVRLNYLEWRRNYRAGMMDGARGPAESHSESAVDARQNGRMVTGRRHLATPAHRAPKGSIARTPTK